MLNVTQTPVNKQRYWMDLTLASSNSPCGLNRFVHEGMNNISNVKVYLKTLSGNVNILIWTLTLRNCMIIAQAHQGQLRTAAGVTVSDQTNQNRLHAECLRAGRPFVRILLQQRRRMHRLDWCWQNLRWNGLLCSRVVAFSDESNYNLYFNVGHIHVYRLRGERYFYVNVK